MVGRPLGLSAAEGFLPADKTFFACPFVRYKAPQGIGVVGFVTIRKHLGNIGKVTGKISEKVQIKVYLGGFTSKELWQNRDNSQDLRHDSPGWCSG